MQTVTEAKLGHVLNGLPGLPRVVTSGNFATPWRALSLLDAPLPDVVLVHTSMPADGTVSLGVEVNVLPAAIEAVRARGGLVIAQLNPRMPYTFVEGGVPPSETTTAI